jgi:UDP-2,3-diacylglucosamine pyrophosphatase LpxH/glycosyltransferase involved in cell wall biosynthesis
MNIDIVTDTFAPDINGVAMTLGRLSNGLRALGHRVHVMHTGASAGPDESLAASFSLPGYREVRLGLPKPIELRARWSKRRPDVIYVATESPLGKSALKAAQALDIPAASGFHTNFHEYIEPYGVPGLESLAMAYLRNFHQRARCTFTPSRHMARRLAEEGIENVHLLGRGVDTELFDPSKRCGKLRASWGARPAAPVAIIVGRVAAEKNLPLAIEAFRRMKSAVPDMQCVVVGDGPLRAGLERDHGWIHFAGMRTGEDLARHYASADVLVFPSETETFGNVLLEGMASGLATVSYDYAASAMHITHGRNGLKVPPGDRDAYITMAVEALRHPPGSPLREEARRDAEALGWDKIVREFESRLSELTGNSKQQEPITMNAKKPEKLVCRTVFLSDIHLGTPGSKADEVVSFLKRVRCEKLVLNGDIIDGWALRRGGRWLPQHTRVIRRILKMSEKDATDVIYLRGNHDEILERFLPLALGKIRIAREHIHTALDGARYLVVHGDGFDSVSTHHKWLAVAGAFGYDFLISINRFYNLWRAWRGKEYFSLSQAVKARVKSAVCFVDSYEELLQQLARKRGCQGIICGHIHTPENKQVGDIHYLNSGDWVESMTAIIEHLDGRFELIRYKDFMVGPAAALQPRCRNSSREESLALPV